MSEGKKQLTRMNWEFNWQTSVEEFLEWKKLQGVSKYAIIDHRQAWKLFLQQYPTLDIEAMPIVRKAIMTFLRNRKAAYYNKLLQAIKQFFDYLIQECDMKIDNPCKGIKYKAAPVRIVDHDNETIRKLIQLPKKTTFVGYRDYVFMLLMIDTGIRPHEAIQLKIADMESKGIWVREEVSKTRQPRFLPISNTVIQCMKRLIAGKAELNRKNNYIFVTNAGKPLSPRELRFRFRQYAESLNITITPYHLRHYFALNFIRNGGNVFALQKIMGHSKLDMTQVYVNLVSADLQENHKKASPLTSLFHERK